ncbi:MAG: ABC transporter ATP-binding protein, partial [Oscillospiraceae bacterium]|nr:ABC transporter ATP-binding protein [Oscillospiraceae bacterium]
MFLRYLWKKKWLVLLYIALFTAATVLDTQVNLMVPGIFDDANVGKYDVVITKFGIIFIGVVIFKLMEYYANLAGAHFVNAIRMDIKKDLFRAVLKKQLPDYADRNAGEYIAEFTNDITVIEERFFAPFRETVSSFITCVTVGVAIFTIDYRMVLVLLGGIVLCLLLPVLLTPVTAKRMMRFLGRFDRFVQYLKDVFGAFFTFKNYAVEDKVVDKFAEENDEVERLKYKAEISLALMNALVGRVAWAVELLVLIVGLFGVIYGNLTFGQVFAAYLLAGKLGSPLSGIGDCISSMRSVRGMEKKFKDLGMLEDKLPEETIAPSAQAAFDIRLENVSLTLKENPILTDISLTFEKGKKYLILGTNGSGKSSIAKLIKNNFRSYTGTIQLGGYDLQSPEGQRLSRCVSYSNETVALFSDTVENNILLYRDVPATRFEEAIALAELNVAPERQVGDSGKFLSSGERRKLEIARAMIESPNVLILDEVVSTLDIETAYEIEKLVLSFKDRTIIMISNAFSGQLLEQYDR